VIRNSERMNQATECRKPRPLKRIVTIDGPAAAGKSTVAKLLAKRLGFLLLDSGALYRGLALHLMRHHVSPDDPHIPPEILDSLDLRMEPGVATMALFLCTEDVTTLIRDEQVGLAASRFSVRSEVRQALLVLQRSAGSRWNLVAEGRDMGTVVFPDASAKFFLSADLAERSARRFRELAARGEEPDLGRVRREMEDRDLRDQSRELSPLVPAPDAIRLDATDLSPEAVVDQIMRFVSERLAPGFEPRDRRREVNFGGE
jgi:CMP/dCMP kinase